MYRFNTRGNKIDKGDYFITNVNAFSSQNLIQNRRLDFGIFVITKGFIY
jgi:hypothetical protein